MSELLNKKEFIGYKGEVTLTLTRNGKFLKRLTTHNEGKKPLFKYLMYCMTGTYYSTQAPRYIRIFDASDNELTLRPIVRTGEPSYEFGDTSASSVMTFNVPSSVLTNLETLQKIKLYSYDTISTNEELAEIELDEPKIVVENSTLIVAWKMTIANIGE